MELTIAHVFYGSRHSDHNAAIGQAFHQSLPPAFILMRRDSRIKVSRLNYKREI